MIKLMVLEFIHILMVQNMKDNGLKISNMGKEKKHGRMVLSMKVTTLTPKNKVRVILFGQIKVNTQAISIITTLKEMEFIIGIMVELMMVNGSTTKWKELELLLGLTVANT